MLPQQQAQPRQAPAQYIKPRVVAQMPGGQGAAGGYPIGGGPAVAVAAAAAVAAAPPAPAPAAPAARGRGFVKGDLVDYKSSSYQCWIPAVVNEVDPETGCLQLDVKPQPIRLQDQEHFLRPRSRPTKENVEWMHVVMREARLSDELQALWQRHVSPFSNFGKVQNSQKPQNFPAAVGPAPSIPRNSLASIAAEVDTILGTCGSLKGFIIEAQKDGRDCLTYEGFETVFWLQLSNALHSYGQALPTRNDGLFRRENPANVYAFEDVIAKTLGMGSFGKVKLVRERRTNAKRAVKCISKAKVGGFIEMLDAEVDNLCLVDHPNIAKLYEYFDYGENVYLVMDYCSGGELQHKVRDAQRSGKPLTPKFVQEVTRQILLAVAHIHAHGIVHLDVKSANVMLMPNKGTKAPINQENDETLVPAKPDDIPHVMVIDLGVSQIFRPGNFKHNHPMGTPATMAPEVWRGEITPKADVFSIGVVLFEMMALRLPLLSIPCNRADAIRFWKDAPAVNWALVRNMSPAAVEFCKTLMAQQRHLRPTAWNCLNLDFMQEAASKNMAIPAGVMHSVSAFPERSVLYKSIALQIARRWPSNQWPTVLRWFKEMDTSHSGRIDKAGLSNSLQQRGVDAQLAASISEAMDLDCDGSISWTEFVASCIHLGNTVFEPTLKEAFDEADSDDDGLLTQRDLAKLFPLSSGTEVVRNCFIDLTGRSEPGARLDWSTFRRHFRGKAPVQEDQQATIPNTDPGSRCSVHGFPAMLAEAADKVVSRFFPTAGDPEKEEAKLKQLRDMGFGDRDMCLSVLRRHRCEITDSLVEELVRLGGTA